MGYTAAMRLPNVPNSPVATAPAPSTDMYRGTYRLVIRKPRLNANIATESTSTSRSSARNPPDGRTDPGVLGVPPAMRWLPAAPR